MRSQMIASPKLVTPPPPNIHTKQPMRFTARVALFTVGPKQTHCILGINVKKYLLGILHRHTHAQKRLEIGYEGSYINIM